MARKASILVFWLISSSAFSQNIEMAEFKIFPDSNNVLLNWCLESGSVCNGMTVFRSTDSINYDEIGTIPGICGSSSSRVFYNFMDKSPVYNVKNYYKLRLGYYQYSEVKIIYVKYIEKGKVLIKPNPSTDNIILEFNNENKEKYTLIIYDENGKQVYFKNNINEGTILLNGNNFSNCKYFFKLSNEYNISHNGTLLFIR